MTYRMIVEINGKVTQDVSITNDTDFFAVVKAAQAALVVGVAAKITAEVSGK